MKYETEPLAFGISTEFWPSPLNERNNHERSIRRSGGWSVLGLGFPWNKLVRSPANSLQVGCYKCRLLYVTYLLCKYVNPCALMARQTAQYTLKIPCAYITKHLGLWSTARLDVDVWIEWCSGWSCFPLRVMVSWLESLHQCFTYKSKEKM